MVAGMIETLIPVMVAYTDQALIEPNSKRGGLLHQRLTPHFTPVRALPSRLPSDPPSRFRLELDSFHIRLRPRRSEHGYRVTFRVLKRSNPADDGRVATIGQSVA